MKSYFHSRLQAIRFALSGCWYILRTQPNAWIHAFFTVIIFLMAIFLELPPGDFSILVLTFCLVWFTEAINTSIEVIVDLISPQKHPFAKAAKDVGAAAVLIAAAGSVIVGLLLLGPPLAQKITIFISR